MDLLTAIAADESSISALSGLGLLGKPPDELVLLIRGAAGREETVRLSASKCTIGSDPACTLAIDEFGIRPLHCLILRGQSQTVVRRLSAETRLNGCEFSDALLRPGDRLSLGPLELEVLALGAANSATPLATEPDRGAELRRLERELDEREQIWKHRCEQREAEFAKWEQQLLAGREELESQRRALDADRTAFSTERQDWETVQDEARTRLNEKLEQANHRLAELAAERQSHERRRSAWTAQRQNLTEELNGQFQALRSEQTALAAERERLAEARAAQEAEALRHEAQFAERQREMDRLRSETEAELAQRRTQAEQERQTWDAERAAWQRERLEFEGRRAAEQQQHGEALAALAAAESELKAERAAFEAESLDGSVRRSQLESELQAREARLIESQQETARREELLAAERRQLEERQQALQIQRQEHEAQSAKLEAELAAREARLAEREARLAEREAAPATPSSQEPSGAQDELECERRALAEACEAQQRREQEFAARLAAREQEVEQILVAGEQEVLRLHNELAAERQIFEAQRAAWQAAQAPNDANSVNREQEREERLAAGELELSRWKAKLTAEREAFEAQRKAWAEERQTAGGERDVPTAAEAERAARLDAREREIEQLLLASEQELSRLQADLAAERRAVEEQRQAWEIERREFEELRAGWSEERRRQEAAFGEDRERFEQERAEWEACRSAQGAESQAVSAQRQPDEHDSQPSPRSTADLLSRFGMGERIATAPEAKQDDRTEAEPEPELDVESSAPPEQPRAARSAAAADEEEQGSIDDYMAQLMQRLGARGAASQSHPEIKREPKEPSPTPEPVAAETIPAAAPVLNAARKITPRATPAESTSDMSAMRALALQNARAALEIHARRTIMKRGPAKLFIALLASASAGILIWFHLLGHARALSLALFCMLIAVAFVGQFLALRRGARLQAPQHREDKPAERDPFSALRVSDLPADDDAEGLA